MNKIFKNPIFYTVLILGAFIFLQTSGMLRAAWKEPASSGELNAEAITPIEVLGAYGSSQSKIGPLKFVAIPVLKSPEAKICNFLLQNKCGTDFINFVQNIAEAKDAIFVRSQSEYPLVLSDGGMVFPSGSGGEKYDEGTVIYDGTCLKVYTGIGWRDMCPKE